MDGGGRGEGGVGVVEAVEGGLEQGEVVVDGAGRRRCPVGDQTPVWREQTMQRLGAGAVGDRGADLRRHGELDDAAHVPGDDGEVVGGQTIEDGAGFVETAELSVGEPQAANAL